jgi:hypothetical protein
LQFRTKLFAGRSVKENMILCGLWFGETKPFMSIFTKPIMKSLKHLENNGINYEIGSVKLPWLTFLFSVAEIAFCTFCSNALASNCGFEASYGNILTDPPF